MIYDRAFQVALVVKNPLANAGNIREASSTLGSGRSPGGGYGNPLQYSAWRILWTENPGGLQSIGSHRVRHTWRNLACMHVIYDSAASRKDSFLNAVLFLWVFCLFVLIYSVVWITFTVFVMPFGLWPSLAQIFKSWYSVLMGSISWGQASCKWLLLIFLLLWSPPDS